MKTFIRRLGAQALHGVLSGLDRIRFRGTHRLVAYVKGMASYLWRRDILLKDFKAHAEEATDLLRQATERIAAKSGRPLQYLPSSSASKEDLAREIARRDGVREGLIAVFSCVEPCLSYVIYRNRLTKHIELQAARRKCLHYSHYFLDPRLGFFHVRQQSWYPFTVNICLNGREWLARQMEAAGIGYVQRDNCFVEVADVDKAQALLDKQLQTDWPSLLERLARRANPVRTRIFGDVGVETYWSVDQSEWATDVMFRSPAELAAWYPRWLRHGLEGLHSKDVMRYLGHRTPIRGYGRFCGEVVTDLKERPEGVRIKHRLNGNSIKMYDKQGSVLRVETTINDARDLKVYRPKEGDEGGAKDWRYLRKGVADLHRRAEVSQAANERYLESLAAVEETTPLGELAAPLCRPVQWQGKRVRALNPLAADDATLLEAVNRGEFALNGFRNHDIRVLLYGGATTSELELRSLSSKVTRKLRLLRAHGLIRKVPSTHRYLLSDSGRAAINALLAARRANSAKLTDAA